MFGTCHLPPLTLIYCDIVLIFNIVIFLKQTTNPLVRLQMKIDEDFSQQKTLEKPEVASEVSRVRGVTSTALVINQKDESSIVTVPPESAERKLKLVGTDDLDQINQKRRDKVKEVRLIFYLIYKYKSKK